MKKLFIILALLSTSAFATHTCTTCYVDPVGGDDTNTGASKVLAWKHLPGMPSCTGVCATQVPVAGDSYIQKGGTTWTGNTDLGIVWKWAGSSASPIRITVDPTWFTSATVTGQVSTNGTLVTRVVDSNPISYPFSSAWVGTTITINGSNFTITSVTSQNSLTLSTSAGSNPSVAYSYTGFTRPIWDCNSEEACGSAAIASLGEMAIFNAQKQWVFVDNIEATNMTFPVDRGNVSVTAWNATSTTAATFTGTNTFAVGQIIGISGNFAGSGTQFNGKPMRVTASNGSTFSVVLVRSTDSYTVSSGSDTATFIVSSYIRNGFESSCGTSATPSNFHGSYIFWHSSVIPAGVKNTIRMNFAKSLNNCAVGSSNGTTWQYDTCDETDEVGGHGGDCFVTGDIVDSVDAIRNVGLFNGNFNQITNSNLLHFQTTSLDSGDHCDIAQIGQFSGTVNIFANNVVGDNSACNGGTNIGVNQFSGPTSVNYSYGNVIWGINGNQAIFSCGAHKLTLPAVSYGICNIYNNSAISSGNTFMENALAHGYSTVNSANNYYTTPTGTATMCLEHSESGFGAACNNIGGNLQQSTAVATASPNTPGGYTAAGVGGFALAPGAVGWSTVAAGLTKAALDNAGFSTPTPSTDTAYGGLRVTSTRPSVASWGIGAYEFGVSPWTITVSCQGTANGTIKEPANGANINAVCTAGVASGTTFASYVNGTAVTLVGASTSGTFIGWTDALCSSFVTSNCTFNAGSSPTITAAFQLVPTNTLSCSPCNVNLGTSVTLTTTVANMQSPAVLGDNWTISDPNGDPVFNNSVVQMSCEFPTVCNGTFNGGSSPSLTFTPTISGTYTIQSQSGSLQSTAATVNINVSYSYGGRAAGAVGH